MKAYCAADYIYIYIYVFPWHVTLSQFYLGYVTDICVYSSSLYAKLATKERKGEYFTCFDDLLTMRLSITLGNDQVDAHIF